MKKNVKRLIILATLLLSVFGQKSQAQDSLSVKSLKLDLLHQAEERKWTLRLPLWVPGFTGSFAYGGITQYPEGNDFDF